MQRLVFYGKGGIGKSTLSSNISAALSAQGVRTLHVGCDPKHDSTVSLMAGELIPTILDRDFAGDATAEQLVRVSSTGVHCVEAGGPQAGVGCAGRGISRTVDILRKADLLSDQRYDAVVYDLLGDVVCGGFAAPLRRDVGEKVVLVSSEELMSLYAANNVARAVVTYAANGIVCAGLILNLRDPVEDLGPVRRFAELIEVPILGILRRDPLIREAEYRRCTVVEHAPAAPITRSLTHIAQRLYRMPKSECVVPRPLSDREFHELARNRFEGDLDRPERTMTASSAEAAPSARPEASAAPQADRQQADYARELAAGIEAVRRGLVEPSLALSRLQNAFPRRAATLAPTDLVVEA